MSYLMTMGIGVFLVALFPMLPNTGMYLSLLILLVIVYWAGIRLYNLYADGLSTAVISHIFCLALGVGWGIIAGHQQLAQQLPDNLDKQQFIVQGSVVGLVERQQERLRFSLAVHSIQPYDETPIKVSRSLPLKKLLLSWYITRLDQVGSFKKQINSGDQWQLLVRLRRPRGMLNPGGFDYQAWLVEQGFSATGYVLASSLNRPIEDVSYSLRDDLRNWLSRLRQQIYTGIHSSQLSPLGHAVITALTIGDKSGLDDWWNDLARWGIVHLMVISGLHVGLVASLGFFVGLFINRPLQLLLDTVTNSFNYSKIVRFLPPLLALLAALIYSALAGFSLPTQRALIAVAVVMCAKLAYKQLPVYMVFAWAFFLISISQPLAVLSASFWLSFGAVAILLLWFTPWVSQGNRWRRALSSQLALFAGMAVLGIGFLGHVSWLGPLINSIAVPWVSMVTVPLCLLGLLSYSLLPEVAKYLWTMADWSINVLWCLLQKLPAEIGFLYLPVPATVVILCCLFIAALTVLMPPGTPYRWLYTTPLFIALLAPNQRPSLRLTVLDVGQGLAVVVELPENILVYDSGPAYSEQFNAGSGVIVPFLHHRGHSSIDKLLISHEDGDHAGGFYGLIKNIQTEQALLGSGFLNLYQESKESSQISLETDLKSEIRECENSQHWSWTYWNAQLQIYEPIDFYVLAPNRQETTFLSPNNASCVLLISWQDQRILLTGDIEKKTEQALIDRHQLEPVTLLIAPHHGSKTSSSQAFVDAVKPSHVVFSAGFRHHFGHPHPDVVSRYRQLDSQIWNTALHGAITYTWQLNGDLKIEHSRRVNNQSWWR